MHNKHNPMFMHVLHERTKEQLLQLTNHQKYTTRTHTGEREREGKKTTTIHMSFHNAFDCYRIIWAIKCEKRKRRGTFFLSFLLLLLHLPLFIFPIFFFRLKNHILAFFFRQPYNGTGRECEVFSKFFSHVKHGRTPSN